MAYTAAVITVSDKGFRGERTDTSGPALCKMLEDAGFAVIHKAIVPDEQEAICRELLTCSDERSLSVIVTTGGTGFSPRDITPEATRLVMEREAQGLAEAMRAESMKITPKGCLSRGICALRKRSIIINLPGSEKAAKENLAAIIDPLRHGVQMLLSEGSANCAAEPHKKTVPSMDAWLKEAKLDKSAPQCGMYLFHNGVVRQTSRTQARTGTQTAAVAAMEFSYDREKVSAAEEKTLKMTGIHYVRTWLNEGRLCVGEDIMFALVGGDTRPHVLGALEALVQELKTLCVCEKEIMEEEA
ncbi:MAG: MogA/MoaB family molybdenum cofactor biosynthesis protein [Oscillospiraceae bacterium]|nr:MogA/MoaB family molybdenum cofactor biosynthesis protein [Oscillospiraceae bacterium]